MPPERTRGRDSYEETKDRLPRFWAAHPTGRVATAFVVLDHERGAFICRARLYRDVADRTPFAEGWCEEHTDPQHMINRAYALENCETGAVGRALANGNFASGDHARPTGAEMGKAERQGTPEPDGVRVAPIHMRRQLERLVEARGLPDGMPWPIPVGAPMHEVAAWIGAAQARPLETPKPERRSTMRADKPEPVPAAMPEPETETGAPVVAGAGAGAPESADESRPWRRRPYPFGAPEHVRRAYWRLVQAALPGVGNKKLTDAAREIATERGLPLPGELADIDNAELVDAVFKWADNRADQIPLPFEPEPAT